MIENRFPLESLVSQYNIYQYSTRFCIFSSDNGPLQQEYSLLADIKNSLDTDFCCEAMGEAQKKGMPEYFYTDQGVQFTSNRFTSILKSKGIKISMDGKGQMIDNIFIERFWITLKYEELNVKS